MKPTIFISSVSRELKTARQLVASTLHALGYEPVWQDIFATSSDDLRDMLRKQIDDCSAALQIVGDAYGAEPPGVDPSLGRVSYTQFEALYARSRGKPVYYLVAQADFPRDASAEQIDVPLADSDAARADAAARRELQQRYRQGLLKGEHVYYPVGNHSETEVVVRRLRDDLEKLRRGFRRWTASVIVALVLIAAGVAWLLHGQSQQKEMADRQEREAIERHNAAVADLAKLKDDAQRHEATLLQTIRELPNNLAQGGMAGQQEDLAQRIERAYADLEVKHDLPAGSLRQELPKLAERLLADKEVSSLDRAKALLVQGKYAEAEAAVLAASEEDLRQAKQRIDQAIEGFTTAGWAADGQGHYAEALKHFQRAAALVNREQDPVRWATAEHNVAYALFYVGDYQQLLEVSRNVADVRKNALGPQHPDTLTSMSFLALALDDAGRPAEALLLYEETVPLLKAKLGPDHPNTLRSMGNLANALVSAGRTAEALPLCEETLRLTKAKLGPDHPDTLASMGNLANALDSAGRTLEALPLYEETLRLRKVTLGPDHPATLTSMNNLAYALDSAGRTAEALPLKEETFRLTKAKLGPNHPDTLISMSNLAYALLSTNRTAEALTLYEETLRLRKLKLGPDYPDTLTSMNNLAFALNSSGRTAEAIPLFEETLRLRSRKLGPDHAETIAAGAAMSLCLLKLLRFADAEPHLRLCLKWREKNIPDRWFTPQVRSMLGETLVGQKKDFDEAEQLLLAGYNGLQNCRDQIPALFRHQRLDEARQRLVSLYEAWDKPEEAAKWRQRKPDEPAPE